MIAGSKQGNQAFRNLPPAGQCRGFFALADSQPSFLAAERHSLAVIKFTPSLFKPAEGYLYLKF